MKAKTYTEEVLDPGCNVIFTLHKAVAQCCTKRILEQTIYLYNPWYLFISQNLTQLPGNKEEHKVQDQAKEPVYQGMEGRK